MGSAQELLATLAEYHRLFDGEKGRAEALARSGRVLGRHEVAVGAVGVARGELEHLGTQCGEQARHDPALVGRAHGGCVHRLEVGAHGGEGTLVAVSAQALDEWPVAHSEAEHEAVLARRLEAASAVHCRDRVAGPDRGDARRDGH